MKILFTADHHIKLGQRMVPVAWQKARFKALILKLNEAVKLHECDLHIMGGDILDVAKPSPEELKLFFDLLAELDHETLIYTGNHEALTKKHSSLYDFAAEVSRCNPRVKVTTEPYRSPEFDVVDYIELHTKDWEPAKSKLCFTHVRGEIPPHVKPEINLTKFNEYGLVISGDLHSHENTQKLPSGKDLVYPGSPMSTSFHRTLSNRRNGYIVVDTESLEWEWHSLELPQLLRKTVQDEGDIIEDDYHRVVYELEGDVLSLGSVDTSNELLDKKVNTNVSKSAKLQGLTGVLSEEVTIYCKEVLNLEDSQITSLLTTLSNEVKNLDDNT